MFVKKFEGESLDEALQAVKRELGPDAIILKTVTNKGLKGAFKKNRIEITAAISEQTYEKKAKVDHVLTHEQQDQFYQAPASAVNNMINDYNDHMPSERTQRRMAAGETGNAKPAAPSGYGNMGLNKVVNTVSKASNKIKNSLDDFLALEEEEFNTSSASFDEFMSERPTRREAAPQQRVQTPTREERMMAEPTYEQPHSFSEEDAQEMITRERQQNAEVSSELRQQIKSQNHKIELLEQKLYELTEKISHTRVDENEPKGIKGLRTTLRSLDLSEGIIQSILKKAVFELSPEEQNDADTIYDFTLREMNGMVNTGMPLFSSADVQDEQVVTVLMSENACGQSSMAMKLAVMQENVKIIRFREHDLDNANSEFTARVFKLDIATVNTLSHLMSEARKAVQEGKSIIMDLRLNFKEANESKKFIETLKRSFNYIEFLTTISAINSEVYNRKILSKYKPYSNGVIISYIDQCLSFGSLLNLHSEFNEKPLKFFGTGPTVPDDMEAATAERILAGMFQL